MERRQQGIQLETPPAKNEKGGRLQLFQQRIERQSTILLMSIGHEDLHLLLVKRSLSKQASK
jgi:hypothetical protein